MNLEFEWDPAKAEENIRKHGVTFEEAATVFGDPLARIFEDPDHSSDEPREIIVGYSEKRRLLLVAFTPRVRIISARPATRRERQSHAKNTKKAAQEPS